MKALVSHGPNQPFSLETVDDPKPEKGEAVAKILACGAGLTVQHVKAGRTRIPFPRIMGHEIAAEIVELNGDCGSLSIGMPVTAYFYLTCGHCKWCLINRQTLCGNFGGYVGRACDGGYAEYIKLPAKNFVILKSSSSKSNLFDNKLIVGYIVVHERFGKGEVISIEGQGGDRKAEIMFEKDGLKKLLLRFSRLEIIS